MIIQSVHVTNFRSIRDGSLSCDVLTAIVGRNGSGKSSFLSALDLFYEPTARANADDFYASDTTQDVEIRVTFGDLTEEEEGFSKYVADGALSVTKVFAGGSAGTPGTYHGSRLQNPDFAAVRNAGPSNAIRAAYREVREQPEYAALPSATSADAATNAIEQWEENHPERLSRMRDDGQFFGFAMVGQGNLGRHTKLILVPAVRDASEDATEGRGSPITEIMDLVVRSVLEVREDVTKFKADTQAAYQDLLDPAKLTELDTLAQQLTATLKQYVPDADVALNWSELAEIAVPLPQARVRLSEDGYESAVERTGHGLQRAFILTMLQHLLAAKEPERDDAGGGAANGSTGGGERRRLPNLVLAVEEPELYQHPSRQRHMASVLLTLAQGNIPGVAERTQVVYTTHSPLFVGLNRFDQIRVLQKSPGEQGMPKTTTVSAVTLKKVAEDLWELGGRRGDKFTAESLRPRMQSVMTPWMNEGFFADTVVLVEGEGDLAAILAVAEVLGHDLPSMGVAVIPCRGKSCMDRPALVFTDLGIPSYLVWDNDRYAMNSSPEMNKTLLRLVRAAEEDWPTGVWKTHACLDGNLGTMLRQEFTAPVFDGSQTQAIAEYHITKDQAKKNPFILRFIIETAYADGHTSQTLEQVVGRIVSLVSST